MDLDQREQTQPESAGHIKRRGLVAGLAVLVAGVVAKTTEHVAEARHSPGTGTPGADSIALHLDSTNTALGTTTVNGTSGSALFFINNPGGGINVDATTGGGTGTAITATSAAAFGAIQANNTGTGLAVNAFSNNGGGVKGQSGSVFNFGTQGIHTAGNSGLFGQSASTTGVQGTVASGGGQGVFGHVGTAGIGVLGQSGVGVGVQGTTTAGGLAGRFVGNVSIEANSSTGQPGNLNVNGNLTVSGTKSAAVPLADGSLALLYCLEAPDSYFEDFYQGQLSGGRATVNLDAKFAQTVQTNSYQVFITAYGASNGLYVTNRSASGFTVQENDNGSSNVAFSARVVAKRKDVTATRLAAFSRPSVPAQPAPRRHQVRGNEIVELPDEARNDSPPSRPTR